ncbi:uncharacterized protein LOC135167229 isoform X2 [Diachasmimorpha longicaudata]|uniref:uncharacterized protein LOC135167229 isoform X2 n=1 Tax=Diachasmimorpha longicaudata TaxID=58733 RepID=UPI0030B8B907
MPSCAIVGCTVGYSSNPDKGPCFSTPKDPARLKEWKFATKMPLLKSGDPICYQHFRESEIERHKIIYAIDGTIVQKKGAIPSQFVWTVVDTDVNSNISNNCELHATKQHTRSSSCCSRRSDVSSVYHAEAMESQARPLSACSSSSGISRTYQKRSMESQGRPLSVCSSNFEIESETINSSNHSLDDLFRQSTTVELSQIHQKNLTEMVKLPADWSVEYLPQKSENFIFFSKNHCIEFDNNYKIYASKRIIINQEMVVKAYILDQNVSLSRLSMDEKLHTVQQVEDLLFNLDKIHVCDGSHKLKDFPKINSKTVVKDISNVWRHTHCLLIVEGTTICNFCLKAKRTVAKRLQRLKNQTEPKKLKIPVCPIRKKQWLKMKTQVGCARRIKQRAQKTISNLKSELEHCRVQIKGLKREEIEQYMQEQNIEGNQFRVVKQILASAKRKSPTGRRYDEEWMVLALLLHTRSSSTYQLLRSNGILPLPCPRTIQNHLSTINTVCGFDAKFFELLKLSFEKKSEMQRHGLLLLDEMATRESITVDTKSLTYRGLQDFGEDGLRSSKFTEKANHGLVILFQPLADTYTQPIAVFASRGPVKGDVVASLILRAITLMENVGAKIHGVITDGASSNRKFWSEVGVSGTLGHAKSHFIHPLDDNRKVFVFSDTPHLFKCIRNRWEKVKVLQRDPGDSLIDWNHVKFLHERDQESSRRGQLKLVPKLTANHFHLNNSSKMRVSLAVQIFSNSVYRGLNALKDIPELKDSQATAEFCKWLNDLFDALNRKHIMNAVTPTGLDWKLIQSSLDKLNIWEQNVQEKKISRDSFLTQQTADGLRVTLMSMLHMVKYLVEKYGFPFVFTGRVNQDALEKFFGSVRQAGGSNDHPSTPTFLQIYKILSTFSVLKPPTTGNCTVTTHQSQTPLLKLSDLKSIYDDSTFTDKKKQLIERIDNMITNEDWSVEEIFDHDYSKPGMTDCLVYCLSMDLIKRILHHVKCIACKNALLNPSGNATIPEASLTQWNKATDNYHPNTHFYKFILYLESLFEIHRDSLHVFDLIITDVLKSKRVSFPCTKHGTEMLVHIIQFFVMRRMQEYCTSLNASRIKTNQYKKKQSKWCTS